MDNTGIVFYTDMRLDNHPIGIESKKTIKASGLPIASVSLRKPTDIGDNIVLHAYRSHMSIYTQILVGLSVSEMDYVFFCEADVLYHPSHFEFVPPTDDKYYYNNNVYKYRLKDEKVVGYDSTWLSQLCANRKLLIEHFTKRLRMLSKGKRAYGYEPGTGQSKRIDDVGFDRWESKYPNVDIRHKGNWTGSNRFDEKEFIDKGTCTNFKKISVEEIPGWDTELLLSLSEKK